MPVLELAYGNQGLDPWADFSVMAVMWHPNDEALREEWMAVQKAEWLTGVADDDPQQARQLQLRHFQPDSGLRALMRMVLSEESMSARRRDAMYAGAVVGDILRTILQLETYGHGGTLTKAKALLESGYKNRKTLRGNHVKPNRTDIHNAWKRYKGVAHLWAAYRHRELVRLPTMFAGEDDEQDSALLSFLRYAEAYRRFGSTHLLHGGPRTPLMPPAETWIVRIASPLPFEPPHIELPPLPDLIWDLSEQQQVVLQNLR